MPPPVGGTTPAPVGGLVLPLPGAAVTVIALDGSAGNSPFVYGRIPDEDFYFKPPH